MIDVLGESVLPNAVPLDEPVKLMPEPVPPAEVIPKATPEAARPMLTTPLTPAETLFASVRGVIQLLLKSPMKDAEVAAALDVSTAQARTWLQRLVEEGVIERQKKPAGYIVKHYSLFE